MTTYYLDPSAWVKRYFGEPGTAWISDFWATDPNVACSTVGLVEVLCAIVRGGTYGKVDRPRLAGMLRHVEVDFSGFEHIPFDSVVLEIARQLPEKHSLRGADAIHLASAMRLRENNEDTVTLVSSDRELLEAAASEGFATIDPVTIQA